MILPHKLSGHAETILLLEDEESVRLVTSEFLAANGYHVVQAACGCCAIAMAEQHGDPIALVISDIVLPDIRGPLAVIQIRASHPEAQVLYVSGYAEVLSLEQLVSDGNFFLEKPVSGNILLRKLDEILHPDPGIA